MKRGGFHGYVIRSHALAVAWLGAKLPQRHYPLRFCGGLTLRRDRKTLSQMLQEAAAGKTFLALHVSEARLDTTRSQTGRLAYQASAPRSTLFLVAAWSFSQWLQKHWHIQVALGLSGMFTASCSQGRSISWPNETISI